MIIFLTAFFLLVSSNSNPDLFRSHSLQIIQKLGKIFWLVIWRMAFAGQRWHFMSSSASQYYPDFSERFCKIRMSNRVTLKKKRSLSNHKPKCLSKIIVCSWSFQKCMYRYPLGFTYAFPHMAWYTEKRFWKLQLLIQPVSCVFLLFCEAIH